ncbi:AMP-binding protein [Kitasatospora sp. NPDC059571]|uniref:AMP-binding protein n=1 Tax=Kitasatospora sp. NPDC059571 TaxID=3346871 RepID=UPI0036A71E12
MMRRSIGQELFVTDWVPVTQDSEQAFQRAALLREDFLGFAPDNGDPWGDSLVSGFLLLSMIVAFHKKHLRLDLDGGYGLNYGVDKVRFVRPVLTHERVRLRAELVALEEKSPGRLRCLTRNTLEVEGAGPAMIADWITLFVTHESGYRPSRAEDAQRTQVPPARRAVDFLHHWATRQPDAELDVFGGVRRTYAEGRREVRDCAAALLHSGVCRGDRVAVMTTPRPEFLTLFFALSEIGAVWVGLDTRNSRDELAHIVEDSGASVLFTLVDSGGRDYRPDVQAVVASAPELRRVITIGGTWNRGTDPSTTGADPAGHEPPGTVPFEAFLTEGQRLSDDEIASAALACRGDDTALIVYTSGSTGRPKGAMIAAGAFARGCLLQATGQRLTRPRVLAYLPVNHVGGVMDLGIVPIAAGGCLMYQEHFEPGEALGMLQRERITLWGGIPTMFLMVAALPCFDSADLSSLRHIAWGGAPMPAFLVAKLRRTGARLITQYGLTEACVALTYTDDDADDTTLATTIGRPDPRLEFRIASPDDLPVAVGEQGEIQVRHTCLMQAYWGLPDATAAAFTPDGFLRTGDLAIAQEDGNVRLVGRSVEMYKSGGYNVYPREVELALERHEAVERAAVVVVPHAVYHEVGMAYVVPRPGRTLTQSELESWCRQELANYKRPKRFQIITDLPLRPNGKIDKRVLTGLARDLALES